MHQASHVVVVDDHRDIRELLSRYLSQHFLRVSAVDSVAALRTLLAQEPADLIVLDIMMPGEDGLSACRELRQTSQVPVIFLTAMADDADKIAGLELGADDYLVKPFNPRELLARIRTILRRSASASPATATATTPIALGPRSVLAFHDWTLHVGPRELQGRDGVGVALSTAEFRLLKVFLEHPHEVLSREQLLDLTAGRSAGPLDRTIDNQISRLRKKIEPDPKSPLIIQTHWGGGYSLCVDVEVR
jgi:two-component system OmpR family response regulator